MLINLALKSAVSVLLHTQSHCINWHIGIPPLYWLRHWCLVQSIQVSAYQNPGLSYSSNPLQHNWCSGRNEDSVTIEYASIMQSFAFSKSDCCMSLHFRRHRRKCATWCCSSSLCFKFMSYREWVIVECELELAELFLNIVQFNLKTIYLLTRYSAQQWLMHSNSHDGTWLDSAWRDWWLNPLREAV